MENNTTSCIRRSNDYIYGHMICMYDASNFRTAAVQFAFKLLLENCICFPNVACDHNVKQSAR